MNQVQLDIRDDDRPIKEGEAVVGKVVDRQPDARRVNVWLWEDGKDKGQYLGELFLTALWIERLVSVTPLLELIGSYGDVQPLWSGKVPAVEPHPKLGKAMKVLKGLSSMFKFS